MSSYVGDVKEFEETELEEWKDAMGKSSYRFVVDKIDQIWRKLLREEFEKEDWI